MIEKLPDNDNSLMFQPELRYDRFTSGHRNTHDEDRYDGRSINVHREDDITNVFALFLVYTIFLLGFKRGEFSFVFS